tara:strand:+ start:779 stop:985 length:207 start_codon:yes stop_codon:yes gene_type:complete
MESKIINIDEIMDYKAMIGAVGMLSSLTLNQVSAGVSLLIGLVTLGYMMTKWYGEWNRIKHEQDQRNK